MMRVIMPAIIGLDLLVRYLRRKRLHRLRAEGLFMSSVVAVGYPAAVANLINELRRDHYHGLQVVAACLAGGSRATEVAGIPVVGELDDTADVVRRCGADTVAVLSCPEMDGVKLRRLAWELEKKGHTLDVVEKVMGKNFYRVLGEIWS